jgi:hypothetical protein
LEISGYIIAALWGIMSLLMVVEYAPLCAELKIKDKMIVGFIFLIGAPLLAAASILEAILNTILPEGWDDEDDDNFQGH